MYLTHFKLASQPFAERVTAESLWQDDRMRQWPPGGTFSHLYGILNALERRAPVGSARLEDVLEKAGRAVRRRGPGIGCVRGGCFRLMRLSRCGRCFAGS